MQSQIGQLVWVIVISLTAAAASVLIFAGYPGVWLTQFYQWLFGWQFPSRLELGGLFFVLLLSALYPIGMIVGYLVGFMGLPAIWSQMSLWLRWVTGLTTGLMWTVALFIYIYQVSLTAK